MFVNKGNYGPGLEEREGLTLEKALELTEGWTDPYPPPLIRDVGGIDVVDESVIGDGSKARFADLLVSQVESDELVYVAPRFGWAGISLAAVAKRHGKRLTLFMPACQRVSEHQLVAIERGASPIFYRIAAMPNLNKVASEYAEQRGAFFIPLGLRHETVVATIARVASDLPIRRTVVWTAASTGVLTRGLQLAWPDADFNAVAVARNLQDGELGRARFFSYDQPFAKPARSLPPFDCAENYDAKAFELMVTTSQMLVGRALFWNVAGNARPQHLIAADIDSQRAWGELPR